MPTADHTRRELLFKIVYYGPGLGGKTTNLEQIHARTRPELRGRLVSLNTEAERTLFFDLLPVDLGRFHEYSVRLHLCTVPGQVAYQQTRNLVLRNADGVVFVADSQRATLEADREAFADLRENLQGQGVDPDRIPLVVQYNKRDLADAMPRGELAEALGLSSDTPQIEATASQGEGVFETLKLIIRECIQLVPAPAQMSPGRSPSILPGRRLSSFPEAFAPASQRGPFPAPPRVPEFQD